MAKSKNDVNIHFEGKTDGLVIKLNGKIVFPYQEEKIKKEISPNKLKTQLKAGVAAAFSGGVNRIVPLRQTWKRWPVKSRVPYRNILAANIKKCTAEHPTLGNMICPHSGLSLPEAGSHIDFDAIRIGIKPLKGAIELTEKENTARVVGILSVYNPREKDYESCTVYPLNAEVINFNLMENIAARFSITNEMAAIFSKYEKCILYFTVVVGNGGGMTKRWFKANYEDFVLRNDAEGKFAGGAEIRQKS